MGGGDKTLGTRCALPVFGIVYFCPLQDLAKRHTFTLPNISEQSRGERAMGPVVSSYCSFLRSALQPPPVDVSSR